MNKNMSKYLILSSIFSVLILLIIILFNRPIGVSTEISPIFLVPSMYWMMMAICLILITISSIISKSKYVNIFNGSLFFFIFYSFNLFFKIIPTQTDIGTTRLVNFLYDNYNHLSPSLYNYYEFPLFFTYGKILKTLLGLDSYQWTNIGFFSLALVIPILTTLIIHRDFKGRPFLYFLVPSIYMILSFHFINDQFMPQYLGLIFLIISIGCYVQFKDFPNSRFYFLVILFFTLCVYTHAFMFFFFVLGVFYYQLFLTKWSFIKIKKLWKYLHIHETFFGMLNDICTNYKYYMNEFIDGFVAYCKNLSNKIIGRKKINKISIILMSLIYYYGYKTRFRQMDAEFERLLTIDSRSGSWYLLSYFLGSKEALGLISFEPHPLTNLVSPYLHVFTRLSSILILLIIMIFIIHTTFTIKKRKILFYDIINSISSIIFLILGFFFPHLLGQRTLQVTFFNMSKYSLDPFKNSFKIITILSIFFVISPIIFTMNLNINYTMEGTMFYEDLATLEGGEFIEIYAKEINSSCLVTDRNYYPLSSPDYVSSEYPYLRRTPHYFFVENNTFSRIDMILDSPKLENRMNYFNFTYINDRTKYSIVFDQGESRLFYQ